MAKPYYVPVDRVPIPPKNAEVFTTCCDYCIVACGYKVYRWPVGKEGGKKAEENALGIDFPIAPLGGKWISPNQHNIVSVNGKPHNIVVIPDADIEAVNLTAGDHSIRGGCIAKKVYNPNTPTKDRLQKPMIRVNNTLTPVSWDLATDVFAEVSKYVIKNHSENAWACKTFAYQFLENTYAITRFGLKDINTPAFAWHDAPNIGEESAGIAFAGFMTFGPSYWDRANADVLFISGTDPFETKTILWNQWIMPAVKRGMKVIMVLPRKTAGAAFAEANRGLFLDIYPGTDTVLHMSIARIIVENNWQDMEFIKNWTSNFFSELWETESGFGRGTRNTHWQWITTWGKLEAKGYEDWKKWLLSEKESEINTASEITGVSVEKIRKAAEMLANPQGKKKISFGYEKGNYWSNNYLNTASLGALALLTGCGNRPGRMLGRFGGHQRGGVMGGSYPGNKSADKFGGRRRLTMDLDRWLESGHVRFAYVVGTTWTSAMTASQGFMNTFNKLTRENPHQITSLKKEDIIDALKKRVDSGGMVIVDQDIYLRDPIGARYADIVLPASGWGEENFTRANGERRIRLYQKFYDAPGEAMPDWKIVAMIAKKMGFEGYNWKDSNEVFEEASRHTRGRQDNNYDALVWMAKQKGIRAHDLLKKFGTTGIQCPVAVVDEDYKYDRPGWEHTMSKKMMESPDIRANGYKLIGVARLQDSEWKLPEEHFGARFVDPKWLTSFNTQSGKANWLKSPWDIFSDFYDHIKPKDDELWITNGRINEIWQSGFDDVERRPYITQRWPENWIDIHPDDAKARGIESGDMVEIYSDRVPVWNHSNMGTNALDTKFSNLLKQGRIKFVKGSIKAVAIVTPAVKKGVAFTNFLDTKQPSNSLVPRVVDPLTNQYRYKLGAGKIKKIGESPYKHDFGSMTFTRRDIV